MKSKFAKPKSIPELEAAAHDEIKHQRYKEAIAAFKDLLKRERRPEWEEGLADAYLRRAAQVAAKGMYQEAALLWENHASLRCGTAPSEDYLVWLARAGQFGKLAQGLATVPEPVAQGPAVRRLTEALALLALENEKLLGQLSKDHAIVRQQPLIKRAIGAYCSRRDAEAEECLQGIPSRSPYRNARILLKALLTFERDRAAAAVLLDRVEADSVCRSLAHALHRQADAAGSGVDGSIGLTPKQQTVIAKLNGYGKEQLLLLREAQKAEKAGSTRPLLETVLRHRNEFGESASRRFCRAALVAYPEGIPLYERAFGKLPPFEVHRIRALHQEQAGDNSEASHQWNQCLAALKTHPTGPQDRLIRALILRRMARLALRDVPEIAVDWLEESLASDPDDKQTYLSLIKIYQDWDDPKLAQSWLDKALAHYPRDPEVLVLAMQAANRRKAFKKAAGYAKTLLQIDPINSQARKFLLDAHLGHARKQLKAGRRDLARQELEQARTLDPHRRSAALFFLEGLVAYQQGDREQCTQSFREGFAAAGGDLAARFGLSMEILGAGLPWPGPLSLVGGMDKNYVADRQELLALVKAIGQYQKEGKQNLSSALQKLNPVMKKSFKQPDLSEEDYFNLCQSFANAGQYDLVKECAKQGLRRAHFAPGLIYFEVYANCKGEASRLTEQDEFRLNMALRQASQTGNQRVAALISGFLHKFEESLEPDFDEVFPIPKEMAGFDPKNLNQLLARIMEVERMSREEMIEYVAEGQPTARFKNLSQQQLAAMAVEKLLRDAGIDPEILVNAFPFGDPGKKR